MRAERRRAGREHGAGVRRLRHERPRDERRGALGRAHRGRRAREASAATAAASSSVGASVRRASVT